MNWFETLVGFAETVPEETRSRLVLDGSWLTSKANGKRYRCGELLLPTVAELRKGIQGLHVPEGHLKVKETIADVRALHRLPENEGAVFQAASQFNLLEMAAPHFTPEMGIGIYANDPTQGPACAIACGAGTIFRNYFVALGDQTGQTSERQVDCMDALGAKLGNGDNRLWTMQNGYAFSTKEGLHHLDNHLSRMDDVERETVIGLLKVGIQQDTEVTDGSAGHLVTQVYCSALPVGYSAIAPQYWEQFARLILDATYEATFLAAVHNLVRTGNRRLFLTLVGGGVFRNDISWILDAIGRSCKLFRGIPLDVHVVSHGKSRPELAAWCRAYQ